MAMTKKMAAVGILVALLIGGAGLMTVNEMQKRKNPDAIKKPGIVNSNKGPKIPEQSELSSPKISNTPATEELTPNGKPPTIQVKRPAITITRDFRAEAEEALKENAGFIVKGHEESKIEKAIREWFDYDKESVVRWVEDQTDRKAPYIASYLVAVWAQKDPAAAAEWATRLPEGVAKTVALSRVASQWASKDVEAALKWATELPDGDDRDGALHSVSLPWARKDPEAVRIWAEQLPEGQLRLQVLLFVTSILADKDPTATAEWVMQLSKGKEDNYGALLFVVVNVVADQWSKKDPLATAEWVMQFPEGPHRERDNTLSKVVSEWAKTDSKAAVEFAMRLPEGKSKNDALYKVAAEWAKKDPLAAAELAMRLPEGNSRNNALSNVAYQWGYKDPEAAKKWVNGLSISDALKESLLKNIRDHSTVEIHESQ